MFMRMDAIRRERLSLGRAVTCRATERGWGYVYVLFCCNPSLSSLRDATRPGELFFPYGKFTLSPRGEALLFCCLMKW